MISNHSNCTILLIDLFKTDNNVDLRIDLLPIIRVRASEYSIGDSSYYSELLTLIKEKFPCIVEFKKQRKLLSSVEEEIWICSHCKTKVPMEENHFLSCLFDKYGIKKGYPNPEIVIHWLEHTVNYLKSS